MIDKICIIITNKIRKEMPDVDDEEAEIINYGLQNIIGEVPKTFIIFGIAYILGAFKITILTWLILIPYRTFSGGFHLHTHIGCVIGTTLFYCGTALFSNYIVLQETVKIIIAILVWIFGMVMIKWYAPADTENVPIISKKIRRQKQILSYITLTAYVIVAIFIKNSLISNILIFGALLQSIMITRVAYKITKNKYGHEVYAKSI